MKSHYAGTNNGHDVAARQQWSDSRHICVVCMKRHDV